MECLLMNKDVYILNNKSISSWLNPILCELQLNYHVQTFDFFNLKVLCML